MSGDLADLVRAERRGEPWPQFGTPSDPRQAARDGFNMAIDIVLDIIQAAALPLDATHDPSWTTAPDGYVTAPLENRGTLDAD